MKKQNNVRALPVRNTRENLPNCAPKTNKGITLIALIITIIVLLILAVVSIRLVVNNGILGKSEKAVKAYSESETEEKVKLAYSDYQMGKLTDSSYTFEQALQNGKVAYTSVTGSDAEGYIVTATISDGRTKQYNVTSTGVSKIKDLEDYGLKVGDYVAYNEAGFGDYTTDTSKGIGGNVGSQDSTTGKYPLTEKTYTTENLGWRVLGVNDKGELELMSDNQMSYSQRVYLANEEGYLYGADELNTMCNTLYGNGTGSTGKVVASGARSLNVDDIDKLAGITTEEQKKKIESDYGVEGQYRYPTRDEAKKTDENVSPKGENDTLYMQSKKETDTKWTDITSDSCQKFRLPGESETIGKISETEIKEGNRKAKNTYYYYTISNYVKQVASDGKSMADIITKGTDDRYDDQWLASSFVGCYSNRANFGMRRVWQRRREQRQLVLFAWQLLLLRLSCSSRSFSKI